MVDLLHPICLHFFRCDLIIILHIIFPFPFICHFSSPFILLVICFSQFFVIQNQIVRYISSPCSKFLLLSWCMGIFCSFFASNIGLH
nr:hypothetical protein Iba_chr07dCG1190 [Ipomoea batatas]